MNVDSWIVLLAFALGFCLSRIRLCTLACVQQLVTERRAERALALAIATSAAGIVLLALSSWWPDHVWLPSDVGASTRIVLGGVLLGMGALVNGGCYLGSITYLGTGNSNFMFTLLGIGISLRVSERAGGLLMAARHGLRKSMDGHELIGVAVFAIVVVLALYTRRPGIDERRVQRRLSPGHAYLALAAGAVAGLLYARHPDWSYGSVLDGIAHADVRPVSWSANLSAAATFAGAIVGAMLGGRFVLQVPTLTRASRCLAGGALMGYGASLVPGGNDMLLLWAIPGLTVYGVLAFGVMVATIATVLAGGFAYGRFRSST